MNCIVIPGRFQPLHNGHVAAINVDSSDLPRVIVVVKGKVTSLNHYRNPLDFDCQRDMIEAATGWKHHVIESPTGYMPDVATRVFEQTGLTMAAVVCGPDRLNTYMAQFDRAMSSGEYPGEEPKWIAAPRVTSATFVREAIRNGDEAQFQRLTPRSMWSEFQALRQLMTEAAIN